MLGAPCEVRTAYKAANGEDLPMMALINSPSLSLHSWEASFGERFLLCDQLIAPTA